MAAVAPARASCAPLLERKATFVQGVQQLTAQVVACSPDNAAQLQELLPSVARAMVLLKTRYSSPGFWLPALALFRACQQQAQGFKPEDVARVQQYVRDTEAFLAANDVEAPRQEAPSSLADVLLRTSGTRTAAEPHYDDAGPIMDDEDRRRRAQGGPAASTSGAEGSQGGAPAATAAAAAQQQQRANLQASILEGIQAVYSGMEAIARGTEAIEQELEAVLAALHNQHQPPSKPPASKKVIASLPRVVLDDAALDKMGRDTACAVCTETLLVGDEVQLLPCKHAYHVACVAPWLQQNNSCPMCRTELPTDDHKYEAEKERKAEEEADRRGAANALSHNEFAYT